MCPQKRSAKVSEISLCSRSARNMATAPIPATTPPKVVERAPSRLKPAWQEFGTPIIDVLRALAGIDQANAEIVAAQAGKEAVQADVTRTRAERTRQEALLKANSATQQKVEAAVADEQRFTAQAASRDADLTQARTLLRSNESA